MAINNSIVNDEFKRNSHHLRNVHIFFKTDRNYPSVLISVTKKTIIKSLIQHFISKSLDQLLHQHVDQIIATTFSSLLRYDEP